MKTVLIMSRGMRLAPMFKVMTRELVARGYRVLVLINTTFRGEETAFWKDAKEITVIDFYDAVDKLTASSEKRSSAFIRHIEEQTGIAFWKATSNYQLYRRLYQSYHGKWPWPSFYTVEADVIKEYVGSYLILLDIFDRFSPDVIFYETIDLISTFIALSMSYSRGKFAFGFDFAPAFADAKVVLSYGVHRQNIMLQHLFAHPELIPSVSLEKAAELLGALEKNQFTPPWYVRTYRKRSGSRLSQVDKELLLRYLFKKQVWASPYAAVKRLRDRLWLDKHSKMTVPEGRFVSFFLQHQPEAASCTYAPRWVDQNSIIEQLAINAPYDFKIVIKENPRTYGFRAKSYFGPLLEMPNVHMCHPAVNSYEVAARSEAILAIIGSIGMEGLLMGKRVAVLGRPYYSIYPAVKKLNAPEEIFDALKDSSWKPETMVTERLNFAAAYIESANDFGTVPQGEVWPAPESGGPRLAQALHRLMTFIESHSLKPSDFDPGIKI